MLEKYIYFKNNNVCVGVRIAQLVVRRDCNPKVGGSTPPANSFILCSAYT